ncbi:MAG: pyridoxal 5'-phosphate synthase lyase subunit PdxS [Candidatus Methanomethylophilaceae archaeon]
MKGGVIMDVTTPDQARIAENAGACAVRALERIPADIRAAGGVSRMSDPKMIRGIQDAVSIPVMAKVRIGHFVEAQILEVIEIDYIDESELLSPADDMYHIDKTKFKVPFVCGAKDLGEALRRISEGASMIRTKGEPGTGDIIQAVRHMRAVNSEIRRIAGLQSDELYETAKQLQVPIDLVKYVHDNQKLPVVNFAAGGVATPADAALMMQLGAEGVFVGSGIFKSGNPAKRAEATVQAVTNYNDPAILAKLSEDLGPAMVGINESEIKVLMAERGQ